MKVEQILNWLESKVNYCLSEITQKLGADYIVEQGTLGIWTYRKWASGIAECWGQTLIEASSGWGSGGNYHYSIMGFVDLPFTMTEFISCTANCDFQGQIGIDTPTSNDWLTKCSLRITEGIGATGIDQDHTVLIQYKGKWK